MDLFQADMFRP